MLSGIHRKKNENIFKVILVVKELQQEEILEFLFSGFQNEKLKVLRY